MTPTTNIHKDDIAAARKLIQILNQFRTFEPHMPISQVATFLEIAAAEGSNVREVAERVGFDVSQAGASRWIAALGKYGKASRSGHSLVDWKEDPENRSSKQHYLTDKGRRVMRAITTLMSKP